MVWAVNSIFSTSSTVIDNLSCGLVFRDILSFYTQNAVPSTSLPDIIKPESVQTEIKDFEIKLGILGLCLHHNRTVHMKHTYLRIDFTAVLR